MLYTKEEGRDKKRNVCAWNNLLRVKYKYLFVVKLKAIRYKEDDLHYLFSYSGWQAFPHTLPKT